MDINTKYTAFARIIFHPLEHDPDKEIYDFEKWKDNPTIKTQEQIDAHFKTRDAAIGILTGKINDLTVIDFDTKDNELMMTLFEIAPTRCIITRKGFHLYYRYRDDPILAQGTKRFTGGVDVRNDGGLIFAPPTPNYEVHNDLEIAELTDEVLEAIRPYAITHKKISDLKTTTTRNDDLFRMACAWINEYPKEEVFKRMVKANKEFMKGELSMEELETIYQQAIKYDPKKPVSEEDYSLVTLDKVVIEEKDEQRYSIGFPSLDRVLMDEDQIGTQFQGGVSMGEFMIIGGRPKHGKTLLAVQIIKSLTDQGFSSLWLSYEGKMSKLKKIMGKAQVIQENVVVVQLKNSVPLIGRVDWIEEKMKEAIQKYGTKALVIDNLSFLQPGESSRSSKQYDMLNEIVPAVHRLASQYDIVVILLAHVRKPPNQTGAPKRARMYDLSGTSTLEQLCDIGIMVERQYVDESRYSSKTLVHLDANRPCGEVRTMECFFDNGKLVDIVEEVAKKLGGHVID